MFLSLSQMYNKARQSACSLQSLHCTKSPYPCLTSGVLDAFTTAKTRANVLAASQGEYAAE